MVTVNAGELMTEILDGVILSWEEPALANRSRIGTRQRWFATATIAVLVVGGAVATPFADTATLVVPGFFAMFQAAMFVINLLLAALLFIKGEIEGRSDTTRLGAVYLFVTLMIIAQMASFPGGFMPTPLIGSPQTSLWIWFFWHVGFGIGIIRYAWFASRPTPTASSLRLTLIVVPVLALLVTWISSCYAEMLPTLLADGQYLFTGTALFMFVPVGAVTIAAVASVVSLRATTPERLWLLVAMVASSLEVWLNVHGSVRFTLGWYLAKSGSLCASLTVLLFLLHDITLLYLEAAVSNAVLHRLVRLDALTELFNRRGFDEMLEEEFRRARRQQLALAAVLIDIDFFKGFNDRYGHQGGDDCLRQVSAAIKGALWRPGDRAARYGGEEVVILLPATDLPGAMVIAERIRAAVAALEIPHAGSPLEIVTISAGVGSVLPLHANDTAAGLIEAADQALYQAKKDGRNRVCAATSDIVATLSLLSA